jgi:hypothetical protein
MAFTRERYNAPGDQVADYSIRKELGRVARSIPHPTVIDVRDFGALGDGVSNDSVAVQAAISAASAGGVVLFPAGRFVIHTTLQVDTNSVTIRGAGREATSLDWRGTGPLLQLDEDDGGVYDTGSYDGAGRNFAVLDIRLVGDFGSGLTALANGLANYRAGSYGIRDWRGGSLHMERVIVRGFEYGFWGIQSDLNYFEHLIAFNNKTAFWCGPRCDQATWNHIWTFANDTVFSLNGVEHQLITHWASDTDGSETTYPVEIKEWTLTNRITSNIVFEAPWLESGSSFGDVNPGFDVPAFFAINVDDPSVNGGVVIRSPFVAVYDYSDATKRHTLFLVDTDNCPVLEIDRLSGFTRNWQNLRAVIRFVDGAAAATTRVWFTESDLRSSPGARLAECYNAATAFVQCRVHGFGVSYDTNVAGGTANVNVGYLGLHRSLQHSNASMTSGAAGDIILNRTYQSGRPCGWIWDGSAAHPLPVPTMAVDSGNQSITLTPGTDHEYQRFATALTANRTVTLSTTGALNGHRFSVSRPGGGAFTLDVGGLKTLAASEWCVVMYDGSAWRLVSYGAL